MRSRWPILALLCVLASLLAPSTASANSSPGAENRVWDFSTQEQVCVGGASALTLELRPGCELAYDDCTSGSPLAAKGGGKTARKKSKDALQNARDRLDAARAHRDQLKSLPNKTPQTKADIKKADGAVKRAEDALRASENHAQRNQRRGR